MTNKPEETAAKGGKKDKKKELSKKDLNKVSGGAMPTPVNGQITDVTKDIVMTGGGTGSDGGNT